MLEFTGFNWWAILFATALAFVLGGGLLLGAITGVGIIASAMASDSAFCGWGMPLFLIQAGYRVLYSIVIGGILAAWS
jgi:hypothetical protein